MKVSIYSCLTWLKLPIFSLILTYNQSAFSQKSFIPEFHKVTENIYRGGRPKEKELKILKEMGVKTIINLEDNEDALQTEKVIARDLKMRWISSPMSSEIYPTDEQLNDILSALTDEDNFPIFIHCKHGEDRTGLIIGLYRVFKNGWNPRIAYEEMLEYDFHPEYRPLNQCFKDKTGYPR